MAKMGDKVREVALSLGLAASALTGVAALTPTTAQAQTRMPNTATAQSFTTTHKQVLTEFLLLSLEIEARGGAESDRAKELIPRFNTLAEEINNKVLSAAPEQAKEFIATLQVKFKENPDKAVEGLRKMGIQSAIGAQKQQVTPEQQKQYNKLLAAYIERDEVRSGDERNRLEPQIRDQEYALREQGRAGIELVNKARAEAKKIHEEQENQRRAETPQQAAPQPGVPVEDSGIVLRNGATVDLRGSDTAHTIIIARGARATIKRMGPEDKLLCPEGTTTLTYSGTPGNPTVVRARDAKGTVLAEINVVGAYASTENRYTSRQTYNNADARSIIDNIRRGSGRGILNDIGGAIGATNKTTSTNGTRTAASLDQILNSFGVHGSLESLDPISEEKFKQQQGQNRDRSSLDSREGKSESQLMAEVRESKKAQSASWRGRIEDAMAGRDTPSGGRSV